MLAGAVVIVPYFILKVQVAQSCPTLCDPMGYAVHGILQARILEWVAVPFSRGSFQPSDRTQVSRIAGEFFTSWVTREAHAYWSGCLSLLQWIFMTWNRTRVSCIAGRFFTSWATREAHFILFLIWVISIFIFYLGQFCQRFVNFTDLLKESAFCFISFFPYFSCFQFHWFLFLSLLFTSFCLFGVYNTLHFPGLIFLLGLVFLGNDVFGYFPVIFLLLISNWIPLWSEYTLYNFSSFKFIEICSMARNTFCHGKCSLSSWKKSVLLEKYLKMVNTDQSHG